MSRLKMLFLSLLLLSLSLSQAQLDDSRLAEAQAAIAANDLVKAEEIVAKGKNGSKGSEISLVYHQVIADAVRDYSTGDLSGALNLFELAGMITPEDTSAFLYAGTVATELNRSDIIMRNYQKLVDLKTENSQVYQALTYYQLLDGDSLAALSTIETGLEMFSQDSYLRKQQVNLLISLKQIDRAINELSSLIETEPNNANLLFNLGYLYETRGDFKLGREYYEKSIQADPDYFDAVYNVGVMIFNEAADLSKLMNSGEELAGTHQENEARVQKLVRESLPYFEKCTELRPDDYHVWQTLADAYSFVGEYDKTKVAMDKAELLRGN